MTRLAANLTMMFQELPFLERIDAAAAAGFAAVECVMPYVAPAQSIADRLEANGVAMALFNMPPGDWAAGDRGYAANPARVDEFAVSIDTTIDYAAATGCRTVHLMAGKIPVDADRAQWTATLVANVRRAADTLEPHGISIVLEPINTRVDIPGYFYDTTAAALAVIDEVGRDSVKLLYDIYHMQIMEGDLARTIERLLPQIGHVQLADNPGRNEPGSGEINYPWLLARLDALGYDGWVGCEYKPAGDTVAGLGWATPYLHPIRDGATA
ncbi:2-oxo-tetronate isomerase [Sphingomonas nostoxanthinifaciens]|uniref:2-oxo-tetronate isomerase n=1 Tax=Sphingomonas nostoxanthinifaciens TaxID=2872652 RepID=UPI001CC1D387|nr:2-oxo-tetronate isomerase [Sphingomonas nostoxanthinifaciens]UAK25902.1 hydroxypyruvate isomerase family protein [Sphingomonas nostoxanthinifaciens]